MDNKPKKLLDQVRDALHELADSCVKKSKKDKFLEEIELLREMAAKKNCDKFQPLTLEESEYLRVNYIYADRRDCDES